MSTRLVYRLNSRLTTLSRSP